MGRQSARLWFKGKDHRDIYFQGHYHDKMYLGSQLLWEKRRVGIDLTVSTVGYLSARHIACTVGDKAVMVTQRADSGLDNMSFVMHHFKNGASTGEYGWSYRTLFPDATEAWSGSFFAGTDPYILFCHRPYGTYYEFFYTLNGITYERIEVGAMNTTMLPAIAGNPGRGTTVADGLLLIPTARRAALPLSSDNWWCAYLGSEVADDMELINTGAYLLSNTGTYHSYLCFSVDPVTSVAYALRWDYKNGAGEYSSLHSVIPYTELWNERTLIKVAEQAALYTGSYYESTVTKRIFDFMKVINGKLFLVQRHPTRANVMMDAASTAFTEINSAISIENLYYINGHYISVGSGVVYASDDGIAWEQAAVFDSLSAYTSCHVAGDGIYVCGEMVSPGLPPYRVVHIQIQ